MEKYYLANLALPSRKNLFNESISSFKRKIKLVDIQFVRRPSTFGVIQLEDFVLGPEKRDTAKPANQQQISVAILDLADNKTAKLCVEKQVKLRGVTRRIVDFDTSQTISIDGGGGRDAPIEGKQHPHCVLLAENGDLYTVDLINVEKQQCVELIANVRDHELQSSQPSSRTTNFIQCKLQITSDNDCFVHSLADRYYVVHKLLSSHKLELLHEYHSSAIINEPQALFARMYTLDFNPRMIILKLIDSSLQVVHESVCLSCIKLTNDKSNGSKFETSHLVLSTNQSLNECLLISYLRTRIVAQHLHLTLEPVTKDPDRLLLKEPSFEIEDCWTIELSDIDSFRSLDQDEAFSPLGCLALRSCPMWSANQLNPDSNWPKFLIIMYEFHLLVYSFEQPLENPFSLVYDSSFFGFSSNGATQENNNLIKLAQHTDKPSNQQENIDVKQRPKLLHNFKMIGPHPTDSLYNTLFLVLNARIMEMSQFPQLGLVVAISQLGHVIAFKFTSSKFTSQKDSLYQQLVVESLREGNLLKDEATRLEIDNRLLQENLISLDRRPCDPNSDQQSTTSESNSLDSLLHSQLIAREDQQLPGSLYDLSISFSIFLHVSRIVIISTVSSHFIDELIDVRNPLIDTYHIENNLTSNRPLRQVLADKINILNKIKQSNDEQTLALIEEMLEEQHHDSEHIQSYALLNLVEDFNPFSLSNSDIRLPMIIVDGQSGYIKVFYLFTKPFFSNSINSESDSSSSIIFENLYLQQDLKSNDGDCIAFHLNTIKIKPLMTFRLQQDERALKASTNLMMNSITITGQFNQSTMAEWLDECFHHTWDSRCVDTSTKRSKANFYSPTNRCQIVYKIGPDGGQLEISSDDLVAIELIKKHLFRRATEALIKLDVDDSILPNPRQLRQSISSQHKIISMIMTKVLLLVDRTTDDDLNPESSGDQVDLLMDTLTSELELSDENEINWLIESLRADIGSLIHKKSF